MHWFKKKKQNKQNQNMTMQKLTFTAYSTLRTCVIDGDNVDVYFSHMKVGVDS